MKEKQENKANNIDTATDLRRHADACIDCGDLILARRFYLKAMELVGNSQSWAHIGLGLIALQMNDLDEAEMAFVLANQCEGNSVEAYCGLAKVYQLRGRFRDAASAYCTALEIEHDHLPAIIGLFRQCRKTGDFNSIINCLEGYVQRHPDNLQMRSCLLLAIVLAEKNEAPEFKSYN